jgi:hypothetical protein
MNSKFVLGGAAMLWIGVAAASDISNPAIGLVVSPGDFQIDGSRARGNGSLTSGTIVDDLRSPTHVSLTNRTRFDLAPDAQGQIFSDRLVLKRGMAQVWPADGFAVVANGLRLDSVAALSNFRVWRLDEMTISVTAVSGMAAAQTAAGAPVAQIPEGQTQEVSVVAGCLAQDKLHFLVRDQATKTLVEVRGPDVAGHVNHRVSITGVVDAATSPVAGAVRLIREAVLTDLPGEACKPPVAGWVKPAAIGAGVAAAAAVGGLAADQVIFTGGGAAGISPGQ